MSTESDDDVQLVIDDKNVEKTAHEKRDSSSDEELHSDTSSVSSSASRKERCRRRRMNEEEDAASTSFNQPRLNDGVWLADRLSERHTFDRNTNDHHVLLLVSGSVAAIKLQPLIERLYAVHEEAYLSSNADNRHEMPKLHVRIILTECACHFVSEATIQSLYQLRSIYTYRDAHEYAVWSKRGDPVLHVELARWCDLAVVAPMSANTLAKIAAGLCDNLLTCTLRAMDQRKRVLVAPAMNTHMYRNPLTSRQMDALRNTLGYVELPVTTKTLVCGDIGEGAMAEVADIANVAVKYLIENCS